MKCAPRPENLNVETYKQYRRKLEVFERQCRRRGKDAMIEGAYLIFSQLQDSAWDASEQVDLDEIEGDEPFKAVRSVLDSLYQFGDEVELPKRCDDFFQCCARKKGETTQEYIVRHATERKKLKAVHIDIPDQLAGWHMLSRSAIPPWTEVQVKTMCGGDGN